MERFIQRYIPGGKTEQIDHTLSLEECQKLVGGYISVYTVNGLSLVCDEEGKLKDYAPCLQAGDYSFVGTILVGVFTDNGLEPVSEEQHKEFMQSAIHF